MWTADHLYQYKFGGPHSISCDSESLVGVFVLLTNTPMPLLHIKIWETPPAHPLLWNFLATSHLNLLSLLFIGGPCIFHCWKKLGSICRVVYLPHSSRCIPVNKHIIVILLYAPNHGHNLNISEHAISSRSHQSTYINFHLSVLCVTLDSLCLLTCHLLTSNSPQEKMIVNKPWEYHTLVPLQEGGWALCSLHQLACYICRRGVSYWWSE